MSRSLAAAALVACALQPATAGWVESYDKKSNKKFYYDEETRKTQWEKPSGVDIKFLDDDPTVSGGGQKGGASAVTVLAAVMTPVVLVFGGLVFLYWRVRCCPSLRLATLASAAPPCCCRRCRRALRTHSKIHPARPRD